MLSRVPSHQPSLKQGKQYPLTADGYELRDEIGQGVSAKVIISSVKCVSRPFGCALCIMCVQVYLAHCKTLDELVAVKVMDLERQDPGKLVRPLDPGSWLSYL